MYYTIDSTYTTHDLTKVPRNATTIKCDNKFITSLKGCPKKAVDVDVSGTMISSLEGLPKKLERLKCSFCRNLTDFLIPPNLVSLEIEGTNISELPNLPNLIDLNIARTKLVRLPNLKSNYALKYLNLGYLDITNEDLATFPRSVDHLSIQGCKKLTSFYGCPTARSIYCIECTNITLSRLPSTVKDLTCGETPNIDISKIPAHVTKLKLFKAGITSLEFVPRTVLELDISYCPLRDFRHAPTGLKKFEYSGRISNFYGLPEGLIKLHVTYGSISSLLGIPKSVKDFFVYETSIQSSIINCFVLKRWPKLFDNENIVKTRMRLFESSTIFRTKHEMLPNKLPLL